MLLTKDVCLYCLFFFFIKALYYELFTFKHLCSVYRRGTVIVKDSNKSDWLYIIVSVSK